MSEKKGPTVDVKDANESLHSSVRSVKHVDITEGPSFDERRTKNLLWKLDRNIVPFLSLLYL